MSATPSRIVETRRTLTSVSPRNGVYQNRLSSSKLAVHRANAPLPTMSASPAPTKMTASATRRIYPLPGAEAREGPGDRGFDRLADPFIEMSPDLGFVEHLDRQRRVGRAVGPDDYVVQNARGGRISRQRIAGDRARGGRRGH